MRRWLRACRAALKAGFSSSAQTGYEHATSRAVCTVAWDPVKGCGCRSRATRRATPENHPVVVDLHERSPVGRWATAGSDWRRLDRFASFYCMPDALTHRDGTSTPTPSPTRVSPERAHRDNESTTGRCHGTKTFEACGRPDCRWQPLPVATDGCLQERVVFDAYAGEEGRMRCRTSGRRAARHPGRRNHPWNSRECPSARTCHTHWRPGCAR